MDPGPCRRVQANAVDFQRHLIEYVDRVFGGQAYALTRAGAERLIRHCRTVRRPIDDELDRSWAHGLPNLCIFPFPVIAQSGVVHHRTRTIWRLRSSSAPQESKTPGEARRARAQGWAEAVRTPALDQALRRPSGSAMISPGPRRAAWLIIEASGVGVSVALRQRLWLALLFGWIVLMALQLLRTGSEQGSPPF